MCLSCDTTVYTLHAWVLTRRQLCDARVSRVVHWVFQLESPSWERRILLVFSWVALKAECLPTPGCVGLNVSDFDKLSSYTNSTGSTTSMGHAQSALRVGVLGAVLALLASWRSGQHEWRAVTSPVCSGE